MKLQRHGVCSACLSPCILSPVAGGALGRRAACLTGSASPTGWFPAKFVEVLDERSKEVSAHAKWAGPWGPRPFCPEAGALLALGCVPGMWSAREDGEGLAGASDPVLPLSTPSRGTTL